MCGCGCHLALIAAAEYAATSSGAQMSACVPEARSRKQRTAIATWFAGWLKRVGATGLNDGVSVRIE